ncbi:neutral/alkaline non-lysosomal ceramidase N-terminal domain-containing protein [Nannocystaceae bacterium ST9]
MMARPAWFSRRSPENLRCWLALGLACLIPIACKGDDEGDDEIGDTSADTTSETSTTQADTTTGVDTDTTSTDSTTGDEPEAPEQFCPGGPSGDCDEVAGAPLEAGAAVVSIVPECFESWDDLAADGEFDEGEDTYFDCGCDRLCPGDMGYAAPDEGEADGEFQAIYMAGFGNNRPTRGVRQADLGLVGDNDGLWARAIAMQQGNTRVVYVAIDTVGLFYDEVLAVRELLADQDIDWLSVSSTHTHEGPDTMGLWGETIGSGGFDDDYRAQLRLAIAQAASEAIADLREVGTLTVGRGDASTTNDDKGVLNVNSDHRDPFIVDEAVDVLHFADVQGETIATMVNYASHPESMADENTLLTSDYIHALRKTVEDGSQWTMSPGVAGLGGPCIFISGALGGMMTPLGVQVTTPDGDTFGGGFSWEKTDAIGQLLGEVALAAIAEGEVVDDPRLEFGAQPFLLEVINDTFKLAFMQGIFQREVTEMGGKQYITTEMGVIELGPVRMLTVPGELLPELAVGGYDGSQMFTEMADFIDPTNPNPPDVGQAPAGPYLKQRIGSPYTWVIGLGNDELGYIIPDYDFQLADSLPYLDEAEGDHYEETNSLGPHIAGEVNSRADFLIEFIEWL